MRFIIPIVFITSVIVFLLLLAPISTFAAFTGDGTLKTIDQNSQYFATTPYTPKPIASLANFLFNIIYNFGQQITLSFSQVFGQVNLLRASLTSLPVENNIANLDYDYLNQQPPLIAPNFQVAVLNYDGVGGPDTNPTTEISRQDLLDNIQERLDIIAQQVQELIDQQSQSNQLADQQADSQDTTVQNDFQVEEDVSSNEVYFVPAGGGVTENYSKILISEVQLAGATGLGLDDKQEFIELYNPNSQEVDLTNWYLQRKTASGSSWSTYASKNLFSGKKISANGYFLIARTGYFAGLSDIFVDNPITNDNSFALKNPGGDISDKLGFGNAIDPELATTTNPVAGQSVGRKVLDDNTEEETNNNANDFELQTPTPRAQNITYVQPSVSGGVEDALLLDTTPPQGSFALEDIQITADFAVNFTITDIANTVSPSGVGSYVFRWQEQGDVWQEDIIVQVVGNPWSADFSRDFSGQDGKTYNFQIKATDALGNESDWQPELAVTTQIVVSKKK